MITIEEYNNLIEQLKVDVNSGMWKGMVNDPCIYTVGECLNQLLLLINDQLDICYSLGRINVWQFGLCSFDRSTLSLFKQMNGRELFDYKKDDINDVKKYLYEWLDTSYESKRYLTGMDYEHYELNSDIEVDECGGMYHTKTQTLLKVINPNIDLYWIKEGTKHINKHVFYDFETLRTLVIPDSIMEIANDIIYQCPSLTFVIVKGKCHNIEGAVIGNSWEYKKYPEEMTRVYIPEVYENINYPDTTIVYDKEKIKENIICPNLSNLTYGQLKNALKGFPREKLNETITFDCSKKDGMYSISIEGDLIEYGTMEELFEGIEEPMPDNFTMCSDGKKYKNHPDKTIIINSDFENAKLVLSKL